MKSVSFEPLRTWLPPLWVARALAVACGAVALAAWPSSEAGYGLAFWAWVVAGLALWATLARAPESALREPMTPGAWAALLAILALALALRLPAIATVPANVSIDELLPAMEAMRLASGEAPNVLSHLGWFTIPSLTFAPPAMLVWLWPEDVFFAVRFSSLVTGMAGIVGTFLLARRFFGTGTALTTAFLMAVGFWHIHNSRTGFPFVQTSCAVPWVLYWLVRARQLRSPAAMAGAGVALGFALQLYFPVRVLVLLVPLFLVVGWFGRRDSWRQCASDAGLVGGGAAYVLAPLLISVSWTELLGRSQGILLTRPAVFADLARIYRVESVPAVVWRNFQEAFAMFTDWADVCILNRSPDGLFDELTLAAMAVGVLVAVFQGRIYGMLFVGWAALVFVLGPAISDAPRASYRLGPAMPALYILAAYGIHRTALASLPRWRWYRLTVVPALLGAAAAYVSFANYESFFFDYARDGDGRAMPPAAAMRFAGERCDGREIYVLSYPEPIGQGGLMGVFCPRHQSLQIDDVPDAVSLERPATFIVMAVQRSSLDRLRICYPDAKVEQHRADDRRFLFTSVEVDVEGLKAGRRRCPPEDESVRDSLDRLRERMQRRDARGPRSTTPD